MTALSEFDRLESLGLWKETPDAQRIEVVVSFGDNTLVLRDTNDRPLTHWSMAAIGRLNPKELPAIYAVGDDFSETLEIEDVTMVKAIDRIRARLRRARPKPGRLRFFIACIALLAFAAAAVFWLPTATARYATRIVPDVKIAQMGSRAMAHMQKLTGSTCTSPFGEHALRQLEDRLIGAPSNRIVIADLGKRKSAMLLGGTILIDKSLLTDQSGAYLLAGHVLAQRATEDENPPLLQLFTFSGIRETMNFLAKGDISDRVLDAFTESQLTHAQPLPDLRNLAELFDVAEIPRASFAASDPRFADLASEDPFASNYEPLLSDEDWLALQEICD